MLHFEIDDRRLEAIAREFDASERQLNLAMSRAFRSTARTLNAQAKKELREKLSLRSNKELNRRIPRPRIAGGRGGGLKLWFGANDLPASAFKGRLRATPRGAAIGPHEVEGGFVGRNRQGRRTIMRRVGPKRYPIVEAMVPVADTIQMYVEDEIFFARIEEVFFRYFVHEVKAATIYGVGARP